MKPVLGLRANVARGDKQKTVFNNKQYYDIIYFIGGI